MKVAVFSRRAIIGTLTLCCFETGAYGFTFVSSPPAKLPATLETPNVSFVWDGKSPALAEKDTFRDGAFAGQSDEQVLRALIAEAMATWNNVRGSFVRLQLSENTEDVRASRDDRVNVIVISQTNNLNSAAYAAHMIEKIDDLHSQITDCDITVDTKKVSVEFMLYALTHELGHCLGLGHAHDNYQSIMGYSRTPGSARLGADDKAGVIFLYGDPAYGDPKQRELIAVHCGTVGGGKPGSSSGWVGLLTLLIPLVPLCLRRKLVRR